jgi:cytidine deaminase
MSAPLPEVTRRQLIDLARQAARRAYCPYSRFHVGAALLTDNGRFFTGANVENASYGLTLCAERTAIFAAAAAGARAVRALAVTCPDAPADTPAGYRMPCGACRQVIAEFATPEIVVFVDGVADFGLADLLPSPFTLGPATTAGTPAGEKPRLYVDIDNVLCRTDECIRGLLCDVSGKRVNYAYEDIREYDYRNCTDAKGAKVTREEWRVAHDERFSRAEVVSALAPIPGAIEEMRRLAGRFDVAYITGRQPRLQEATQQWLTRNGLPDGPVLFANRGQKHLVVAGAFALIEDDREQTEPAARAGMHAVLLADPWNETGPNSLSHRCADWAAVSALLCQLAGID